MIYSFDIFRTEISRFKTQPSDQNTAVVWEEGGERSYNMLHCDTVWDTVQTNLTCTVWQTKCSWCDIKPYKMKEICPASRCGCWCFTVNEDKLCHVIRCGFCVTAWCQQQLANTYEDEGKPQRNMKKIFTYVICTSFDLLVQFVLVFIPKRRIPHQQNVKDHTWRTHRNNTVNIWADLGVGTLKCSDGWLLKDE